MAAKSFMKIGVEPHYTVAIIGTKKKTPWTPFFK